MQNAAGIRTERIIFMKKICTYLAVFTALWLFAAGCILRQEHLAARMIRLHIVANSDSSADQAEKLKVSEGE